MLLGGRYRQVSLYMTWVFDCIISELLNKQDTSLAFAAFGAAHFDSFPITVLQMAPVGQPEEFLLCYHGKEDCIDVTVAVQ